MKYFLLVCVFLTSLMLSSLTIAEEIANYADCDVCHGAIHFSPLETRGILGEAGFKKAVNRPGKSQRKVVKIDLDGILVNGTKDTPNQGYELKISGAQILYIRELRDRSNIQIAWEQVDTVSKQLYGYQLHIYLEPGRQNEIDLKDSVDIAWAKMKDSYIYKWVGKTDDKEEWKALLGKKILYAIKELNKPQTN